MVYTVLLEKYIVPRIVPIDITILRGPRRMKLGSMVHRKYTDFAPKLWEILSQLGYKKYLQRIYISIEAPIPVRSDIYQLPITIAVLQRLNIFPNQESIYCIGKLSLNKMVQQDELTTALSQFNQWLSAPHTTSLLSTINSLSKAPKHGECTLVIPQLCISKLFRGIVWVNKKRIDTEKTPASILRRVPEETLETLTL